MNRALRLRLPTRNQLCLALVLGFISICSKAVSQPYGFSTRMPPDSDSNDMNPTAEILCTDLATGKQTHFATVYAEEGDLLWDPDQHWLFHKEKGWLSAISTRDTNIARDLDQEVFDFISQHVLRIGGRDALWLDLGYGHLASSMVEIRDTASMSLVDSLVGEVADAKVPFLSRDGTVLYYDSFDTVTSERYLAAYTLSAKTLKWKRRLYDIGPPTVNKLIQDGRRGKALIGYEYPGETIADGHYVVYDPETEVSTMPAAFPFRDEALLSPTTSQIIAQRVDLDSSSQGWHENRTGDVWVFDASSGRVQKRMKFPPGGTVQIFDADSLHFYYHIESSDVWIRGQL